MVSKSLLRQAPRAALASYRRRWPSLAFWIFHGPLLALSMAYVLAVGIVLFGNRAIAYEAWHDLGELAALPMLWLMWVQPFLAIAAGLLHFGVSRTVSVEMRRRSIRLRFGDGRALTVSRARIDGGFITPVEPDVSRLTLRVRERWTTSEIDLVSHGQTVADLSAQLLGPRRQGLLAGPSALRLAMALAVGGVLGAFGGGLLLLAIDAREQAFPFMWSVPAVSLGWKLGALAAPLSFGLFLAGCALQPTRLRTGTDGLSVGGGFIPWSRVTGVVVKSGCLIVSTSNEGRLALGALGNTKSHVTAWRDAIEAKLSRRANDLDLSFPPFAGDAKRWVEAIGANAMHLGYRKRATDARRLKRAMTGVGVEPKTRIAAALSLRALGLPNARTDILDAARGVLCQRTRRALESVARNGAATRAIAQAIRGSAA